MSKNKKTNSLKSLSKHFVSTSKKVLPKVNNGLKKVGMAAKSITSKSIPIVEKGVSVVYGTMAKGFDLGVKGARGMTKKLSKKRKSKRSRKVGKKTRRR